MAAIRDDLEGVVSAYDEGGVPVILKAGDNVPDGVIVGDHVLADKTPAKKAASSKSEK